MPPPAAPGSERPRHRTSSCINQGYPSSSLLQYTGGGSSLSPGLTFKGHRLSRGLLLLLLCCRSRLLRQLPNKSRARPHTSQPPPSAPSLVGYLHFTRPKPSATNVILELLSPGRSRSAPGKRDNPDVTVYHYMLDAASGSILAPTVTFIISEVVATASSCYQRR